MTPRAFIEHVAIRVPDIAWHRDFLHEVFGLDVTEVDGEPDSPRQVWTVGGFQLIADPDVEQGVGQFAHVGVLCDDPDAATAAAVERGATVLPQGPRWFRTPDGVSYELLQAAPGAVLHATSWHPRA